MHDVLLHVFVGSFSLYDLLLLLLILYTLHDVIGIIVLGLFIIDDKSTCMSRLLSVGAIFFASFTTHYITSTFII